MALTKYQKDISNAVWLDVNPNYNDSILPSVLPNAQAVLKCSLYALLNCPKGDRGGIFEPTYGTDLPWYLQEPLDDITAQSIRRTLYLAFEKWEPRIDLTSGGISVTPDYTLPGYRLRVTGKYKLTGETISQDYTIAI